MGGIHAAKSKAHLIRDLSSKDVKVGKIKSLDWHKVSVAPDDTGTDVKFIANVNGESVEVERQNPSFNYLMEQLPGKVQDMADYINRN